MLRQKLYPRANEKIANQQASQRKSPSIVIMNKETIVDELDDFRLSPRGITFTPQSLEDPRSNQKYFHKDINEVH